MSRPIASRHNNIVTLASRNRPGRRQLVERLFGEHARALRLFLLGWSVPQDQIDDLVQELFTRLMGVAGPERWKGYGYVNWTQGSASLNLTANYSSSYAGLSYSLQERVGNYITFDLTGSYEFGDSGWKVYAGARNITNKAFPFFDGFAAPWDPRRVDPRGRVVHLEIRKSYDLF